MKNVAIFLFVIAVTLLFSCSKNDSPPARAVYVLDKREYKYWKNGVSSSTLPLEPSSIAASGSDIYVAGYTYQSNLPYPTPGYSKNGTVTLLDSMTTANSITVLGSDVYVTGSYNSSAIYWKNGVVTKLPRLNGPGTNIATAITISGSDVYVSGTYGVNALPVYWKNGTPVELPTVYSTGMTALAVSGSDIYAISNTQFWKNGVVTPVSLSNADYAVFTGIVKIGSDIYISGYVYISYIPYAAFWKNGELTQLSNELSQATGISVSGSDVYISGTISGTSSTTANAVYWKNGTIFVVGTSEGDAIATN